MYNKNQIEDSHVRNGWYRCPRCERKLFPVGPDTAVRNLLYQCKHCKHKFNIDIEPRAWEP